MGNGYGKCVFIKTWIFLFASQLIWYSKYKNLNNVTKFYSKWEKRRVRYLNVTMRFFLRHFGKDSYLICSPSPHKPKSRFKNRHKELLNIKKSNLKTESQKWLVRNVLKTSQIKPKFFVHEFRIPPLYLPNSTFFDTKEWNQLVIHLTLT